MRCIGGIATPTDGADDLQKENFDGSDYCADLASDLKDATLPEIPRAPAHATNQMLVLLSQQCIF